jgi:hypothetical protein
MATKYSFQSKPKALEWAMLANGLDGIVAAGGLKAAHGRGEG